MYPEKISKEGEKGEGENRTMTHCINDYKTNCNFKKAFHNCCFVELSLSTENKPQLLLMQTDKDGKNII